MPARRTVLAALASGLLAGCSGLGDDGGPPSDTATPAPLALRLTAGSSVSDGATVGVFPALADSIRTAAQEPPTDVTSTEWAEAVRSLECVSFGDATYTVATESIGDGGYVNEYSVTAVDGPSNESTVRVRGLPDGVRDDVVEAIAAGRYRYDSETGGFQPTDSVYRYENASYAFELETHADRPVEVTYTLERTDERGCVALEPMSLDAAGRDALDAALESGDDVRVTGRVAGALAGYDYVLRAGRFYRVRRPTDEAGSGAAHRGGV